MKVSFRKGFGFGLTSGSITTLGLMVGLNSSTHSALVVVGGIIVIAIADAMSDALGVHVSEEYENQHTSREVWEATFMTFLSKFIVAMTFVVPVLLFELSTAVIVSVVWGLLLISVFSYIMGREQEEKTYKVVLEHLIIAIIVIVVTHYVGEIVARFA